MAIYLAMKGLLMTQDYSIAEARNRLPKLVHEAERGPIRLTRRGRPVAVIVSLVEYKRLTEPVTTGLWDAIAAWRKIAGLSADDVDDVDEVFAGLRDHSAGRDVSL
jgi:prevent-host-death family protein